MTQARDLADGKFDTSTLVVDAANNRVGLGTTTPATRLHLMMSGSANAVQRIQAGVNGYAAQLHLYGQNAGGSSYNAVKSFVNGDSTPQWEITGPEASAEDVMTLHTGGSERVRIDSSGRVGINITPSSWSGHNAVIQVGNSSLANFSQGAYLNANSYYDGSNNRYIASDEASRYYQSSGQHVWQSAASGTAGNAISFSTKMMINASGNVGIGTTSPTYQTTVYGSSQSTVEIESGSDTGESRLYFTDPSTTGVGEIGYYHNGNTMRFGVNSAERMRIDSSGHVLVNATSSNTGSKLVVAGTNTRTSSGSCADEGMVLMPVANLTTGDYPPGLAFTPRDSSSTPSRARAAIGAVSTNAVAALDLVFATRFAADGTEMTGADEKMRIDSAGRVMIGDTNASSYTTGGLFVRHTGGSSNASIAVVNGTTSGNRRMIDFFGGTSTSRLGSIQIESGAIAFNTSSDYRLKENLNYTWDATARLKQLKPVQFNWISDDTNTVMDGFLAHEVSGVVPFAISGEKDEVWTDGSPMYQQIDQSKLVPLLVKTIQELEARIATLEAG